MILRYILSIAISVNAIALNESVALENVPDVSKGAQEFRQLSEVGGIQSLITQIKKCWADFETRKTQGAAARCFALDYTSCLFDDFVSKKRGEPNNDFVRIEKVLTRANRALEAIKIEQKERGMIITDWVRVSESEALRLGRVDGF